MLQAIDIRGVSAMFPTPCKEGADGWDAVDSVDLDETARMTEKLIRAGIGSIAACGTTGEGAALLWEEKLGFVDTVVQVTRRRVPVFAGTTALGTREVVRQMRGLRAVGADGAFVGLPLWQTPTIENSVQFFADLSEAVPDMGIMVYANTMFFKSNFPTEFWEGVAKKAPTVITTKMFYGLEHLEQDLAVAGHQINFMPGQSEIYAAYQIYRKAGRKLTAIWSTAASMGPEPMVALLNAMQRDDQPRVEQIWSDITSFPPMVPKGEFGPYFPQYNAQQNNWCYNASGYIKPGPVRAPYRDLPEHWKASAEQYARNWAELRKKYAGTPASA